MNKYQPLSIPSIVTGAFLLTGCSAAQEPEIPQAQGKPSAVQMQIAREEIYKLMAEDQQALRGQSLDGEGRVFFNRAANELVIYKDKPEDPMEEMPDWWVERQIDKVMNKVPGVRKPSLSQISNETFRNELYWGLNFPDRRISAVVDLTSGRACEKTPEKKTACISVKDIGSATPLAKDISLAYRQLGLK